MEPTQSLNALRPAWVALLITVMLFMVGAWAAAYFRQWPLPATWCGARVWDATTSELSGSQFISGGFRLEY